MVVEVKASPRVRTSGQSPGRPGRVLKMSGRPDSARTRPGPVRTSGHFPNKIIFFILFIP